MILVNVGLSAVLSGPWRVALSFGCLLLVLATLGRLVILSTSMVGLVVGVLAITGGVGFGSEFCNISIGISLLRIVAFLALRFLCVVVNSQSMLTSPRETCRDCSRIIHRIDPLVESIMRFLASLEYSRRARITSLMASNSGHVSKKLRTIFFHTASA